MSSQEPTKWPMVIPTATFRPVPALNITRLAPAERQRVWAVIKAERPELADLLQQMPIREMQERFDAVLTIDLDQLPASVHHLRK
ncbi:MAG: hypothetical protein AB1450_08185 [Pseudomonadota bacterium]